MMMMMMMMIVMTYIAVTVIIINVVVGSGSNFGGAPKCVPTVAPFSLACPG
jgi:hypothetical protein